jgi:hypothetical protein
MLVGLFAALLAAPALMPLPETPEGPRVLRLFQGDSRYQAAGGIETTYEGVLERQPGAPGRYRLAGQEGGERVFWLLTLPDGPDRMADLVGQRLRVFGKLSGTSSATLWPASMESLGVGARMPVDGVLARSVWQPAEARQLGARHYVFRDSGRLAKALGLIKGDLDQTATTTMSGLLGVAAIDWDHQMVVTVCAGLRGGDFDRLRITRVERGGDALTIFYKLEKSVQTPGGFGYPAETILVNRSDGPVRFVDETARK